MDNKILMVLDDFFPPDPRVEREAIALVETGYEVYIWAFSRTRNDSTVYKGFEILYHKVGGWQIKVSAIAMEFPFYRMSLQGKLKKLIEKLNPDFIHVHDIRIAPTVFSVKPKNVKLILDLHENRSEIMKFYPHLRKFPGKYLIRPNLWAKNESTLVKNSDAVIAVTEEARAEYLKLNKNSHVVTNSIDASSFRSYPRKGEIIAKFKDYFNLLYIGDLGRRRGIEDCIIAIEKVKVKIPNVMLILVGYSSEMPLYESLITKLGLEDHVTLTGFQDQSLLPSYIDAADVGLCPLWRNAHHDTTYANKLFQYMTLGLPQIVSDCPAQAALIRDTNSGLVFKSQDVDGLCDSIVKMKDDELRSNFSVSAIKAVDQKWDWAIQKNSLLNVYKSL